MSRSLNLSIVIFIFIKLLSVAYADIEIDTNIYDILNSHMMPMDMFAKSINYSAKNKSFGLEAVFHIMDYNRKLMSSYMISDFLTKEIMNLKSAVNYNIIEKQRRRTYSFGVSFKNLTNNNSSHNQSWINRDILATAAFEPLGKIQNLTIESLPRNRRFLEPTQPNSSSDNDFDYGDITGYAYEEGPNSRKKYVFEPQIQMMPRWNLKDSISSNVNQNSKSGYDNAYEDYMSHGEILENAHSPPESSKQKKEISFKDVTDIALTTLAFLSFGMFTLQVLMCIVMGTETDNSYMMLPIEATESTDPNDGTEEIRRRKRSLIQNQTFQSVSDVSTLMLSSLDQFVMAGEHGNVHYTKNYHCDLYSDELNLTQRQRVWMLLYRFGLKWISHGIVSDYIDLLKYVSFLFKPCN